MENSLKSKDHFTLHIVVPAFVLFFCCCWFAHIIETRALAKVKEPVKQVAVHCYSAEVTEMKKSGWGGEATFGVTL